jgi:hypothetical protein
MDGLKQKIHVIIQFKTLLSSRLPSNNFKIKIYETIILPIVPYDCKTFSLALRDECRLLVFKNEREADI